MSGLYATVKNEKRPTELLSLLRMMKRSDEFRNVEKSDPMVPDLEHVSVSKPFIVRPGERLQSERRDLRNFLNDSSVCLVSRFSVMGENVVPPNFARVFCRRAFSHGDG